MAVKQIKINVNELTCERCNNVWQIPIDKPLPKVCWQCKQLTWNTSRKRKEQKG